MKRKIILSAILGTVMGAIGGGGIVRTIASKKEKDCRNMSDKHLALFLLMNEWLRTKQEGKEIKKYFDKKGYKSIAIYGFSYIGERLLDELENCGLHTAYAIDKNAASIYSDIDVYTPDDLLPEADVVVVTAVYFFDEIRNGLVDKVSCPIVSLEDILYEME